MLYSLLYLYSSRKALGVSGFPSAEVVAEFLRDVEVLPDIEWLKNWKMPQLNAIQVSLGTFVSL